MSKQTAAELHEIINGQQALNELVNTPYYELAQAYAAEGVDPETVRVNHVRDWDGRTEGARRLMLAVRYLQGLEE